MSKFIQDVGRYNSCFMCVMCKIKLPMCACYIKLSIKSISRPTHKLICTAVLDNC